VQYKPDWEKVQKHFIEYWACDNHDRPLLCVTAPKDKRIPWPKGQHRTLRDRWLDTEYMLESANVSFQNTYFGADSFPCLNPNLGPDLFASLYGVPVEFGEDTSWSVHNLTDWTEYKPFKIDRNSFYYKK
jgi:hypothetical protein